MTESDEVSFHWAKAYLDLVDKFRARYCPICSLSLQFETTLVEDARLKKSRNVLCSLHTVKILEKSPIPDWKEEILLMESVLNKAKQQFENQNRPGIWDRLFKKQLFQIPKCSVCRALREYEGKYLKVMLNSLSDQDFQSGFAESVGICIPHTFDAMAGFSQHKNLITLIELQIRKLRQVRDLETAPHELILSLITGKRAITSDEPDIPILQEMVDIQENTVSKEIESWFDTEKLKRKLDHVTRLYSDEASRAASLHFRLWKALEDIKTLEMNLAGANSSLNWHKEELELLRKELNSLKRDSKYHDDKNN